MVTNTERLPERNVHSAVEQTKPPYGITQINDKPATSIRYEIVKENDIDLYNLGFYFDRKKVNNLKSIDEQELRMAIGEKNANSIVKSDDAKGSIKGHSLINVAGYTKDAYKKLVIDSQEEKLINTIEYDNGRDLETISSKEATDRIQRHKEGITKLETSNEKGDIADQKAIDVENLSEKATELNNENKEAKNTGKNTNYDKQIQTEAEKNRQIELMEIVNKQFHVSGSRYLFKDRNRNVAFTDRGSKIVSNSNEDRVARAMAIMADAKGWKTIKISGHNDFRREVWLESKIRGIEVNGYRPTQKDLYDLEKQTNHRTNQIEKSDSKDKAGIDKETSKLIDRDSIKFFQKVAEKVLTEKVNNAGYRDAILKSINNEINIRAKEGRLPKVTTQDRSLKQPDHIKTSDRAKEAPIQEQTR